MKHTVFIVLLVVIGYFAWDNTDRNQRPDILLKAFAKLNPFGGAITIDFYEDQQLTEQNIESHFKNLHFGCGYESSKLGDKVCWSYISSFNGLPADSIAIFFENDQYSHIRKQSEFA